uniref:Glutaredoxin domain-containing protein n=1 Tax=Oryza brachyantha TaxID=4533 RepID=J3LNV1_ORYBR
MDELGGGSVGPFSKKPTHLARSLTYHHHPYQGQGRSPSFRARRQQQQQQQTNAVVLYTTSLRGVRRTFADCSAGAAGQDPAFVCGACGGVRFVPCPACDGSRKVFVHEEGCARRCGDCNENGLCLGD